MLLASEIFVESLSLRQSDLRRAVLFHLLLTSKIFVESLSLRQSDLSRAVLSHLLLTSRLTHLELGNSNFRQGGKKKNYPFIKSHIFNLVNRPF
jgi:uncharacterized protein YjbI with pentapeptide repeats